MNNITQVKRGSTASWSLGPELVHWEKLDVWGKDSLVHCEGTDLEMNVYTSSANYFYDENGQLEKVKRPGLWLIQRNEIQTDPSKTYSIKLHLTGPSDCWLEIIDNNGVFQGAQINFPDSGEAEVPNLENFGLYIRWPEERTSTAVAKIKLSIREVDAYEELAPGQLGVEYTNTGKVKLKAGMPGVSKWNELPYIGGEGGSSVEGTIEVPTTVSWDYNNLSGVSFDIPAFYIRAYKVADITPSIKQLLSSTWEVFSSDNPEYEMIVTNDEIISNTADYTMFNTSNPSYNAGYICIYKAGEIEANISGYVFTMTPQETGLYHLWVTNESLSNHFITGSITYTTEQEVDFIQSDWNQTDATKPDYVKNRPFYTDFKNTKFEYVFEGRYNGDYWEYPSDLTDNGILFVDGQTYKVNLNEVEYICEAVTNPWDKHQCLIGNLGVYLGEPFEDNGMPFFVASYYDEGDYGFWFEPFDLEDHDPSISDVVEYHFSVEGPEQFTQKIPAEYLTQPDWNQNDSLQPDYIKNRPFYTTDFGNVTKIPSKYLYQSNWNVSDKSSPEYIQNRPFGTIYAGSVIYDGEVNLSTQNYGGTLVTQGSITGNLKVENGHNYILEFNGITLGPFFVSNGLIELDSNSYINLSTKEVQLIGYGRYNGTYKLVIKNDSPIIEKINGMYLPFTISTKIEENDSNPVSGGAVNSAISSINMGMSNLHANVADLRQNFPFQVTDDDNGKILQVVNGTWQLSNTLGDIDAALDDIIIIQEELIAQALLPAEGVEF